MKESVIIVNESGQFAGTMDKLAAHQKGVLHRAFSIFIFNSAGRLLLQQRAIDKYHSGGLWTNTCCSHPRPGETTIDAANRRLQEEMGIGCKLTELFQFCYCHKFDNGLTEYEYDHVWLGYTDEAPNPDPLEVAAYRYTDIKLLLSEIMERPEIFTPWLKLCIEKVLKNYHQLNAI